MSEVLARGRPDGSGPGPSPSRLSEGAPLGDPGSQGRIMPVLDAAPAGGSDAGDAAAGRNAHPVYEKMMNSEGLPGRPPRIRREAKAGLERALRPHLLRFMSEPPSNYASVDDTFPGQRASAFARSPWLSSYITPETVLGVYRRALLSPLHRRGIRWRPTGTCAGGVTLFDVPEHPDRDHGPRCAALPEPPLLPGPLPG